MRLCMVDFLPSVMACLSKVWAYWKISDLISYCKLDILGQENHQIHRINRSIYLSIYILTSITHPGDAWVQLTCHNGGHGACGHVSIQGGKFRTRNLGMPGLPRAASRASPIRS